MAKKILTEEDEKPLSHALELKLTSSGFEVTVVGNGDDAVEAGSKGAVDLILLDIVMPGKKGFEVLEELKKQHIKTSFIILSNLSQEEDVVKAREMGAIDFFIKSDIPIADIVSLIKKDLRP